MVLQQAGCTAGILLQDAHSTEGSGAPWRGLDIVSHVLRGTLGKRKCQHRKVDKSYDPKSPSDQPVMANSLLLGKIQFNQSNTWMGIRGKIAFMKITVCFIKVPLINLIVQCPRCQTQRCSHAWDSLRSFHCSNDSLTMRDRVDSSMTLITAERIEIPFAQQIQSIMKKAVMSLVDI